jgi:WD40 repeat protein
LCKFIRNIQEDGILLKISSVTGKGVVISLFQNRLYCSGVNIYVSTFFFKVFFVDTLKFFLSLYGHKLPVTAMDISSDSTLIATGSADRNLKFWGLDFGDCHRQCWGSACFWASQIRIQ